MKTNVAIDLALKAVVELYTGKQDRNGVPLAMHPLEVANRFTDMPGHYVIALLHDIKEDFPEQAEAVLAQYPEEVRLSVDLLTRKEGVKYDDYLDTIVNSGNVLVMMVKMADVATNLERSKKFGNASLVPRYEKAMARLGNALLLQAVQGLAAEVAARSGDDPNEEQQPTVDPDNPLLCESPATIQ